MNLNLANSRSAGLRPALGVRSPVARAGFNLEPGPTLVRHKPAASRRSVHRFLLVLCLVGSCCQQTRAADTNPPPRLTVELRDGSRVVGTSVEEELRFHSALLGDLKLEVKDLRALECVSSNSAKLTTANGDTLTVSLVDASLAVKTSFGQVELAADSIRRCTVSATGAAGAHPAGLVALWSGEDNGRDLVGENAATMMDMTFADGQVGRAFALNGFSSWMKIPASPALDVGQGDGLTITAWIKPANVTSFHPILEWNAMTQIGVQLWLGHLPQDRGVLFGALVDTEGNPHGLYSAQGTIVSGKFQHIAMTYDKRNGEARLLVNAVVVARQNIGSFTPQTSYDLLVSRRPGDHPGDWTYNAFYSGLLDELALYNRALSPEEIKSICLHDNNGELPPPGRPSNGERYGDSPQYPLPGRPFNGVRHGDFNDLEIER